MAQPRLRGGETVSAGRSGGGVLLMGDAAGMASDRSGEGMGPVQSAMLAADVIVEAGGDLSADRLARYDALAAGQLLRVPAFVRHLVLDRWFLHGAVTA